jgi:hypothetical protein
MFGGIKRFISGGDQRFHIGHVGFPTYHADADGDAFDSPTRLDPE